MESYGSNQASVAALETEIKGYTDASNSYRFGLLFTGVPLGVLLSAEHVDFLNRVQSNMTLGLGVVLGLVGLFFASLGVVLCNNAKVALADYLCRMYLGRKSSDLAEVARYIDRVGWTSPAVRLFGVLYVLASVAMLVLLPAGLWQTMQE